MFTLKKSLLLLLFLGTINLSLSEQERDAKEERRDEMDVEVEKRNILNTIINLAKKILGK
uniref:Temporin-HN2 n=1 Tax=Odorrana hainanensis TaxID=431935 RepID=TP2_ODOHA|nr:RecName: Full=Temporin-HN2; Flags: Precursor [Odorrana hainanensis]ADV36134.1 temporin-HN2 [Odorrana hainanensis]